MSKERSSTGSLIKSALKVGNNELPRLSEGEEGINESSHANAEKSYEAFISARGNRGRGMPQRNGTNGQT